MVRRVMVLLVAIRAAKAILGVHSLGALALLLEILRLQIAAILHRAFQRWDVVFLAHVHAYHGRRAAGADAGLVHRSQRMKALRILQGRVRHTVIDRVLLLNLHLFRALIDHRGLRRSGSRRQQTAIGP